MTDLATIDAGCIVWTKGANPYGDQRQGGMCVKTGHDPETGERTVTLLTYSPATPRQPEFYVHDRKGYRNLGLVARLMRLPLSDIDPAATNPPDYRKVADYAKRALMAATLPPNDHLGTKGHDALIDCYRLLRDAAVMLRRGVA